MRLPAGVARPRRGAGREDRDPLQHVVGIRVADLDLVNPSRRCWAEEVPLDAVLPGQLGEGRVGRDRHVLGHDEFHRPEAVEAVPGDEIAVLRRGRREEPAAGPGPADGPGDERAARRDHRPAGEVA